MTKKVTVYTTKYCGYCSAALNLLRKRDHPFEEVDISGNTSLRQQIAQKYNWPTVPMVVVDEEFVGGFNELRRLDESGELATRMNP